MAGRRWSVAEPEGSHGVVAVSGAGERYPNELCGRIVLQWRRQTSIRIFASAAVMRGQSGSVLARRMDTFTRHIELLAANRPEVAGDTITLGGAEVELRMVPGLLGAISAR